MTAGFGGVRAVSGLFAAVVTRARDRAEGR